MNKDDIVFGIKWFKKHQSKLLWLLNTPIIKYWFRWVMRIRKYDCPINEKIVEILPNNFTFGEQRILTDILIFKDGHKEVYDCNNKIHLKLSKKLGIKKGFATQRKTDFRTHDKYAKRLYYAFKPLWYLFHVIDWVAFDRYEKLAKLSFGFSTLTVYPDADPESTSVNGYIGFFGTASSNWSFTRDATSGNEGGPAGESCSIGEYYQSWQPRWGIRRGFFLFDTSSLDDTVTISDWVMSVYGINKTDDVNDSYSYLVLVPSNPASNTTLVNDDYNNITFTAKSSTIDITSFSTTGYNDFTGNDMTVISKTGITKLAMIGGHDLNNVSFTGNPAYSDIVAYLANRTGTSQDPKLVITYTTTIDITVTASVAVDTLSLPTPTNIQGTTQTPNAEVLTSSIPTPSELLGITISPYAQQSLFSLPEPEILTPDALVKPNAQVATFSIATPTINFDIIVQVLSQIATFNTNTVDIILWIGVIANAQVCTLTIPLSEIRSDQIIDIANALLATFNTNNVNVEIGIITQPDSQVATFTIKTPMVINEIAVLPDPVMATVILNDPIIRSSNYQRKYTTRGNIYSVKYR